MTDLALDLDGGLGRRAGLEDALRRAIAGGRLAAGTRLPSSRALAADLGVARATVVLAYEQLVAEGYLAARHGAATVVADVAVPATPPPTAPRRPVVPVAADFRPGEPDCSSFPRREWMASMRRVMASGPDALFGYGDARGVPELRAALASYLARSRAVVTDPDRIAVVGGVGEALAILGRLAVEGGGVTVVEDPSLPPHRRALRGSGARVAAVPVDGDGLRVGELDGVAPGGSFVVTTPAHQYPLGMAMPARRRAELVEWARGGDAWIVEDDYDGEFRYDRQPIGALQGLDPDRVVYLGTASKALAPGLRMAWMVLPPDLVGPVEAVRGWPGTVSNLDQAVVADLISSGRFDRHVRRMRTEYRRRRDAVVSLLAERAPALTVTGVSAGLHVTVRLPDAVDEAEVVARAADDGIGLLGLRPHWSGERRMGGLVLGYSRPPRHAFPAALERLGRFLAGALAGETSE